jgi:5-methylcytosine-specific restriction endonuclease McrA
MSIPHGYCQCGCGEKTPLSPKTNHKRGLVKGEPIAYIHGHNRRKYASDKESDIHRKAYIAAYYLAHKKQISEREARRYQHKRDEILKRNAAYKTKWAATPKGQAVGFRENGRRRARKRSAFVEDISRANVFARDKGICGICAQAVDPSNWHLDHIIPLGPGDHSYANVRVTHPECNLAKIAQDQREIAKWREEPATLF